jgi:hypothetical protein
MGDIIRLVPKSELERDRFIREARAIYESIFPPTDAVSEQPDGRLTQGPQPGTSDPIPLANSRSRANDGIQAL